MFVHIPTPLLPLIVMLGLAMPSLAMPPEGSAPPPMPTYQMRAATPDGDRSNSTATAETLFSNHCGYCHLPYGMGTTVLMMRRMPMGASPASALLTNRDDLTVDYIKAVVRQGIGAMPRQTRVDITDSELAKVADFLAGGSQ